MFVGRGAIEFVQNVPPAGLTVAVPVKARAITLTEERLDVLISLVERGARWSRPMDIGGHNGSPHSRLLTDLCAMGLAERTLRPTLMNHIGSSRHSWQYRATAAGIEAEGRS
jgi:hypothetical protein